MIIQGQIVAEPPVVATVRAVAMAVAMGVEAMAVEAMAAS
jgi:hypothetical protein